MTIPGQIELDEAIADAAKRSEQIFSDQERAERGCPTFHCSRCNIKLAFWRNSCTFCGHPVRGFRRKRPAETVTPVNVSVVTVNNNFQPDARSEALGYSPSEWAELMSQGI